MRWSHDLVLSQVQRNESVEQPGGPRFVSAPLANMPKKVMDLSRFRRREGRKTCRHAIIKLTKKEKKKEIIIIMKRGGRGNISGKLPGG